MVWRPCFKNQLLGLAKSNGKGHESFHFCGQSSELNTYIHWVVYNKVFVLLGSSTFILFLFIFGFVLGGGWEENNLFCYWNPKY